MTDVTRWTVVDTQTRTLPDSEVLFGLTLRCLDTGHEYIITISGLGEAPGAEFIAALQAAARHLCHLAGMTLPDGSIETRH